MWLVVERVVKDFGNHLPQAHREEHTHRISTQGHEDGQRTCGAETMFDMRGGKHEEGQAPAVSTERKSNS